MNDLPVLFDRFFRSVERVDGSEPALRSAADLLTEMVSAPAITLRGTMRSASDRWQLATAFDDLDRGLPTHLLDEALRIDRRSMARCAQQFREGFRQLVNETTGAPDRHERSVTAAAEQLERYDDGVCVATAAIFRAGWEGLCFHEARHLEVVWWRSADDLWSAVGTTIAAAIALRSDRITRVLAPSG